MTLHVNVGGTWKDLAVSGFSVNVGGVWKTVSDAYVNVAGSWKRFYQNALLATTITIGYDGFSLYGYENFAGFYGSITQASLTNGNVVTDATWNISAGSGVVRLRLLGTGLANSDATFTSIQVGALGVLTRASASYTANDGFGNTLWTWGPDTSGYPTASTADFTVI